MITIPYYDLIVVPNVTYYFQYEFFKHISNSEGKVGDPVLFLMLRNEKERNEIELDDFFRIGITGEIVELDPDGTIGIKTFHRVDINEISFRDETKASIEVEYAARPEAEDDPKEEAERRFEKLKNDLLSFVTGFTWGLMARGYIQKWTTIEQMATALSQQVNLAFEVKVRILHTDSLRERHRILEDAVYEMMEVIRVGQEASDKLKEKNDKMYREDALRKQIRILQEELEELHPENSSEMAKLEKRIEEAGMNEDAFKEAKKVLKRMKQEGENGHEYGLLSDYLEFVLALDWKKSEFQDIDLKKAEEILENDHYGLKKVKERVLQHLAVMQMTRKQAGSILLFVGPPGTGKTSIGKSIADAMDRKYVRISLGGIRDEAEIRGHRRTYVGAMPGRIMEGIKRSGVSNPVVVLDEVDKLTNGVNGDPSSALLEVLDPEQNGTFVDHYMNVPYDLSDVLFICTANSMESIPQPLLDRMEVITFQSYTESEKVAIAKKHLLQQAMEQTGLNAKVLRIQEKTYHTIISDYTAEAGVRGLKKSLHTICRVAAVRLLKEKKKTVSVSPANLEQFLDRKQIRHDLVNEKTSPGIVTGLAWTMAGGDILFIETMMTKGKGAVQITGQLGDVMKESVQIAVSLVKKMYPEYAQTFETNDIHVHVPAGAVPKDGPSAGITLTTALCSLVTSKTVDPHIAMTGEISLRGQVMPIGGLPEKLMAAVRAGVHTVLIPQDNVEDLKEVAAEVKNRLKIIPVKEYREVLQITGLSE